MYVRVQFIFLNCIEPIEKVKKSSLNERVKLIEPNQNICKIPSRRFFLHRQPSFFFLKRYVKKMAAGSGGYEVSSMYQLFFVSTVLFIFLLN